ncbi:MAG: hypothetical protein HY819_15330 [Acidobacteria bacterium]|nr:hypothetical protein [Acidobacteriota bacterium]
MTRQIIALGVATATGYFLGYLFGLASFPFISVLESDLWISKIFFMALLGFLVGGVTSLISWKHTPGLPGMAFALTLTSLGISAVFTTDKTTDSTSYISLEDAWITSSIEATIVLLATLLTYSAAWLADTQVVFRNLSVKPKPKEVNSKLLLSQLLPCALTTILIAAILRLAFASLIGWSGKITLLCFIIGGFLASYIFKSRSTLWYSATVPFYVASCGMIILSFPDLTQQFALIAIPSKSWNYSLVICGLGAAGSILGHWLRMALEKDLKPS